MGPGFRRDAEPLQVIKIDRKDTGTGDLISVSLW